MKIFFDTNVLVAEALLGPAATAMLDATEKARWKLFTSQFVLDELFHVLTDDLGFSRRIASLSEMRMLRRAELVKPDSTAQVPDDPNDSPILQAALTCGADYLVTNDRHLLSMDPFRGLRIISMDEYLHVLNNLGLLP